MEENIPEKAEHKEEETQEEEKKEPSSDAKEKEEKKKPPPDAKEKEEIIVKKITHSDVCPQCDFDLGEKAYEKYLKVCPKCNYHIRLSANERLQLLVDKGTFKEWYKNLTSVDPLKFVDKKTYYERLKEARKKTGLLDAAIVGIGKIDGTISVFCVLDFEFMGGTMGSVVGEKVTNAFLIALKKKLPLISVVSSGGARMQEGMLSLMQMAKTSAAVAQFHKAGLPYISVQVNPTTGGIAASFSSLGDVIIAEPKALIGFAGPRVIEQTIGEKLPPESHTAEFLLEHGMIDKIIERKNLKLRISQLVKLLTNKPPVRFPKLRRQPIKALKFIDAWEAVEAARNPNRPTSMDYIERIFENFSEIKGDRYFGDDTAVITGIGNLEGQTVAVIAQERGRNEEEKKYRKKGMAMPEGYRKAHRMMHFAEKFNLPLVTFLDTPGAYPGFEAEKRGIAMALAQCFRKMASLEIPTLSFVIGEGGSGGASALAVADRVFMQERAIYSVISPEGAASILYRDAKKAKDVAPFLKLTAFDLFNLQIIDKIIPEAQGGAHYDILTSTQIVKIELMENLEKLKKFSPQTLLKERYKKYKQMGVTGVHWQEMLKFELQQGLENLQKRFSFRKKINREQ